MRYFYGFILICFSNITAISQAVDHIPVQFGQFFNTYSIINPASYGSKSQFEIQSGRQQHGGAWKNISTSFATGSVRLKARKSTNFNVCGLGLIGDKEGEYLKRSNVFFTYAWHTKLSSKVSLSAGASAGFFSYVIAASNANVSGGATAPDASFGLWLYSNTYYLGGSMNQILNSKLTPIEETTKLTPHYTITGGRQFTINNSLTLIPRTLICYVPGYPVDFNVSTVGVINQIIAIGASYRYNRYIVPVIGFEKLSIGNSAFKMMLSYNVPAGRKTAFVQTYELILNYNFKPDGKKKKGK